MRCGLRALCRIWLLFFFQLQLAAAVAARFVIDNGRAAAVYTMLPTRLAFPYDSFLRKIFFNMPLELIYNFFK
jgi:hypothetical protein